MQRHTKAAAVAWAGQAPALGVAPKTLATRAILAIMQSRIGDSSATCTLAISSGRKTRIMTASKTSMPRPSIGYQRTRTVRGVALAGDAIRTWYGSTGDVHAGRGFRDIAPGVVSMSTLNVVLQSAPDAPDVDTAEGVVRDSHSAALPAFFGLHASDVRTASCVRSSIT